MSGLIWAEKHPVATLVVFFGFLYGLVLLAGVNVWVAFTVAVLVGLGLTLAFVIDVSAPYLTLDCRDEHHGTCEECWCECHAPEAVQVSEAA